MKKNWIVRSAYLLLVVLLISTVAVSGTFAKYTWSSDPIEDSARVAKFAFKINETTIEKATDKVTINLFNTIYDTDGTNETDVANNKIAPGTRGVFDLSFQNLSEVTVAVDFITTFNNAIQIPFWGIEAVPIEFTTTPENEASWSKDVVSVIDRLDASTVEIGAPASGAKVYWRWVFDGDNGLDTQLGFNANNGLEFYDTISLTIEIAVDQVD